MIGWCDTCEAMEATELAPFGHCAPDLVPFWNANAERIAAQERAREYGFAQTVDSDLYEGARMLIIG